MTLETVTDQAPVEVSLKKKAMVASVWSILEYGFGMCLRVVSSLVLTRLLLPAYFGEMTLVMTLIVGITLLSDIGLAPSVVQSPRGDDPDFLNTAWTMQAARGVALWLIALVLSWPTALFYHDPQLKYLLPVLALSTLISGFNGTGLLTLARHMGVRRLFAIDGSTAAVALVVTIAWARVRPSVWAIVAGQVISTAYKLCLSHVPAITLGIRNRFRWQTESVHSIVHFGKWIMMATAFWFFASQADRLILGRLITLSLLGIYGIAYQLSDIPRQILLALSQRVAYPFIAKMIHRPREEFAAQYLHFRFYALAGGGLILSLMVTWGGLLITRLYTHPYHEGAWMIPILALGLWQTLLYQTTSPVLLSMGKSKYGAWGNVAYCTAICSGIPIAFHFFGMVGGVAAVAAGDLPLYFAIQYGVAKQGIRPWRQDLGMTGLFLATLLALHLLKRLA